MRSPLRPLLLLTGLALIAPTGAHAAGASFDKACYLTGESGTVILAGFDPDAAVNLTSNLLPPAMTTLLDSGGQSVPFTAGAAFEAPGTKTLTVTATEPDTPAMTATASTLVTELRFQTSAGRKPPKAKRTWTFSGFTPGKPIYGHFRLRGKTLANYRFGVPTDACGQLKVRAPSIPVKGRIGAGTYRIQVDQSRSYKASTKPRLRTNNVVYSTL